MPETGEQREIKATIGLLGEVLTFLEGIQEDEDFDDDGQAAHLAAAADARIDALGDLYNGG
jgi:hypothetical protein